jgi:hypothetical protein
MEWSAGKFGSRKWRWFSIGEGTPKTVAFRVAQEVALLYPKKRAETKRSTPRSGRRSP